MALRDKLETAETTFSASDVFAYSQAMYTVGIAAWLFIGAVIAVLILGGFIVVTASISIPLILAAVIGAVAYPLAEGLRARGLNRTAAALAVLLGLAVTIGLTVWIAINGMIAQWPSLVAGAQAGLDQFSATLASYGWQTDAIRAALTQALGSADTSTGVLGTMLSGFMSSVASGLSGVFGFFFGIFISVTLLYYILHDFDEVTAWLGSHLGLPQDLGEGVVDDAISSMRGYFKGTTLTGLVVAVVIGLGTFLLGVPLAIPIALVTFVTCYIPFFGAIFSGAFAFLVAFGAGGMTKAVALLLIVLIAQNVLQTVISAKYMGESLSLHPIVVLVVTMLGGTLGGLLAAALAAPLTALGVRAAARMRDYRRAGVVEDQQSATAEA